MLTDTEIRKYVNEKRITIEPFDTSNLIAGKYEVHLGKYLLKPSNPGTVIDPTDKNCHPSYERIDISSEGYILKPREFILGQTSELVGLDPDFAMLIDGSSTLARIGITIHQTSTYISPGQDPHIITLEIQNTGIWNIKLTPTMKIGRLIVFKFNEKNTTEERSVNQYNGQKETTGAIFRN